MGLSKLNPFKKDRQNYPGVVIPLASAPSHLASHPDPDPDPEKKNSLSSPDVDKSLDRASSSENGLAGPVPETSHLTIEKLRQEVEADVATSGHDSVYDRMCPILVSSSAATVSCSTFHRPNSDIP